MRIAVGRLIKSLTKRSVICLLAFSPPSRFGPMMGDPAAAFNR